ncbi:hypothetical protein AB0O90_04865 [Microbacterium testaceum]|uniref:hypothetical protein n=1 Tax=Microbacterium testaceum TaxID=2033 RepID=UPI0034288A4F
MSSYTDWGRMNRWHISSARDLADLMQTVAEVAVLRGSSEEDRKAVEVVRAMAQRLALELPDD